MSVGLILEGGAMRGVYTAGALQAFEDNNVKFGYVAGVSAGALTATSFLSGQSRRNYESMVTRASDKRYFGLKYIKSSGSAFNFDFVLGTLVNEDIPLDFSAFWANPAELRIVATDIETGETVYYTKEDLRDDERLTVLRASASLPILSRPVRYKGRLLLDGGMSCIVPLEQSIREGNEHNVIIFTKHRAYEREPQSMTLLKILYRKYPEFLKLMQNRHAEDARERELCFELERQGKAVVICPDEPLPIGKMERDPEKLALVYEQGRREAEAKLEAIAKLF